jgi:hypothetical protein
MAAKKNRVYTETSRKKISASKLIGRLMEHIDGKISLEMSLPPPKINGGALQ